MALRTIPIRRAGNRHNLFMGGDREMGMLSGLLSAILIFAAQDWLAFFVGAVFWVVFIRVLRLMAKADPSMRFVYFRQRLYNAYYPARSTPFRVNTRSQGGQYK